MDTSIRLYNSNSSLHSIIDAKQSGSPTTPLLHEEDRQAEAVSIDEEERATNSVAQQSVHVLEVSQEQAQRVDVADFEAIFLRFQGPITNFIYHMIGNREQACDLAQDVFVRLTKPYLEERSFSQEPCLPGFIVSRPTRLQTLYAGVV